MKQNYFLKTILITCLFVFILKNEQNVFNSSSNFSESFSTNIELVVQANPNYYSDFLDEVFPVADCNKNPSVSIEFFQSKLFRFNHPSGLVNQNYFKQMQICSIHQIISILQKNNSWHQSSDEYHSDIV
jgi:hypothetical protein